MTVPAGAFGARRFRQQQQMRGYPGAQRLQAKQQSRAEQINRMHFPPEKTQFTIPWHMGHQAAGLTNKVSGTAVV
jgi:hypothetical protein